MDIYVNYNINENLLIQCYADSKKELLMMAFLMKSDEVRKRQFFMSKSLKRAEKSKRARIRDLKASKKRKK